MVLSPRLLRPRASGFDPRRISGLAAWWDASDPNTVSLSGSSITSITDKSGNGRTASQGVAANQPTYQTAIQNGRNVMRFDGSNDILTTSAFALPAEASAVLVVQCSNWVNAGGTYRHLLVHGYSPSSPDSHSTNGLSFLAQAAAPFSAWQSNDLTAFGNGFSAIQTPRAGGPTTSGSDFRVVASVLGTSVASIHINNTLTSTRYSAAGSSISAANNYAMGIGRNLASEPWNGDVGEILVYHKQLSATERQTIQRYLAAKWGITLA